MLVLPDEQPRWHASTVRHETLDVWWNGQVALACMPLIPRVAAPKQVEESKRKLLMRARGQQRLDVGLEFEGHHITLFKLSFRTVLIRLLFQAVFGSVKMLLLQSVHP